MSYVYDVCFTYILGIEKNYRKHTGIGIIYLQPLLQNIDLGLFVIDINNCEAIPSKLDFYYNYIQNHANILRIITYHKFLRAWKLPNNLTAG